MRLLTVIAVTTLIAASPAVAQIVPQQPPQQRRPDPSDTIPVPHFREEPPVSPLGAMWRSLLLPGWGQSILGRRVTGAVFIFWEGVTLTMTVKSVHQLNHLESIEADQEQIDGKKREVEDWAVLLVFNHLLAAAEAFVSAELWDFPGELATRRLPSGDVGTGVNLYW
ncbi:MAG: hypothetical protein JSW43_05800 [Gemmatimonadota bacterium]|nr:MAG: hypothetical protein JSW43_05800 [Gemmatimonadota bacterium]